MANAAKPPPAPVPAPADSVSFRKFAGLKNVVKKARLGPDELEIAINVDLDDVGELHRREGTRLVAAGNWSSLFTTNEGVVLGICNGALGRVLPNFGFTVFKTGFSQSIPLSYVQVGKNVYFSSPEQAGIVLLEENMVIPWAGPALAPLPQVDPLNAYAPPQQPLRDGDWWWSPVVNPTPTLPSVGGKILGAPPLASIIDYFNGRIYLAQGRTVWHTELYNYNYVNKTRNFFQFEADVTMLGVVTDGIYVGTTEGLWFMSPSTRIEGHPAGAFKRIRVMDSPVIPGSRVYIPGELANPTQVGLEQDTPVKVSILFMTSAGYCAGQDAGQCFNFTEDKFIFPAATQASAMYRFQKGIHQYVASLNSGGSPIASGSVIGDYVDATIVKKGAWQQARDCVRIGDELSGVIIPA